MAVGFLLTISAVAPYWPALRGEFLNWDDDINILGNPTLMPLRAAGIRAIWTQPIYGLYIPLVYMSYALDLWLVGTQPWWFHAHNLILHVVNTLLVFRILRHLAPGQPLWALASGAALFALHPLQAEAVSWITGRKDLLSTLFVFVSILCYLHARASTGAGTRINAAWWYGGAIAVWLAALLAKPAAVALPFVLLFFERSQATPWRNSICRLLAFFVIAGVWGLLTARVQGISNETRAVLTPAWQRPWVAADALLFYVRKVVWPIGLAPVYGRTPVEAARSFAFWATLPVVTFALALAWRTSGVPALATSIFIGFLLPVLGLVPFSFQRNSTVADRYVYCAMLGVALAVSLSIAQLWHWKRSATRWVCTAVLAGLLVLATQTWRQSRIWVDSETLWRHNLRVAPHASLAYTNLSAVMLNKGSWREAIVLAQQALRYDPLSHLAYANIGRAQLMLGHDAAAFDALHRAVTMRPNDPYVLGLWGVALTRRGDTNAAEQALRKALELNPRQAQAALALAALYLKLGRSADAVSVLNPSVAFYPASTEIRTSFGIALAEAGQFDAAARQLEEAVRLNPTNKEARRWLEAARQRKVPTVSFQRSDSD